MVFGAGGTAGLRAFGVGFALTGRSVGAGRAFAAGRSPVLLVGGDGGPMVGTPFVSGAAVEATVVSHRSGDKIIVFKFEARKRKRRKTGHRQQLSELRIGAIRAPDGKSGERPAANARPASTERPASAKPAPKARKPAAAPAVKTTQE